MTAPSQEDLIEHLSSVYGYDLIYEILDVRQVSSRVEIDYRGVYGEYGMLPLSATSLTELMQELL